MRKRDWIWEAKGKKEMQSPPDAIGVLGAVPFIYVRLLSLGKQSGLEVNRSTPTLRVLHENFTHL